MASYEWDYKKLAMVAVTIFVVVFVYKRYIRESFSEPTAIRTAYAPVPTSHLTGGVPRFDDGKADPQAAPMNNEAHVPYSALDKSVMTSPLDAAAQAPCSCTSAATSTVTAIAPDNGTPVQPSVPGDHEPYSAWTP